MHSLFLPGKNPTIRVTVDVPLSLESTRRMAASVAIIVPRASRERPGR